MSVSLSLNAEGQIPVPGQMDLINFGSNAQEAQLLVGSAPVLAGQAVSLSPDSTNLPKVIPVAAAKDKPWGFVAFSTMKDTFIAGDRLTVVRPNGVLHVIAGGEIAAGQGCEYNPTTGKVIAAAGTNPVCGQAIEAAAKDGMFRMQVA